MKKVEKYCGDTRTSSIHKNRGYVMAKDLVESDELVIINPTELIVDC